MSNGTLPNGRLLRNILKASKILLVYEYSKEVLAYYISWGNVIIKNIP